MRWQRARVLVGALAFTITMFGIAWLILPAPAELVGPPDSRWMLTPARDELTLRFDEPDWSTTTWSAVRIEGPWPAAIRSMVPRARKRFILDGDFSPLTVEIVGKKLKVRIRERRYVRVMETG